MKKFKFSFVLSLTLLGILILITYCSKSEYKDFVDPLIDEFIISKDFQTNDLLSCKSIDYKMSNVKYLDGCKDKPIITIYFHENGKIIASVEAIKNRNKEIKLPNGNDYFMLYRNFSRFDGISLEGQVELYDLNYDNWLFGKNLIINSEIITSEYFPIPNTIKNKYEEVICNNRDYIEKNKTKTDNRGLSKGADIPCDLNENGNVSYNECYKCFNDACKTDETCVILCYVVGDFIGKVATKIPLCQTSISASCVLISIAY